MRTPPCKRSNAGETGPASGSSSFRAPPQQDDLHRLKNDPEIQAHGSVLDVEQVVLQLLEGIFLRVAVFVLNLGPARNSGPHSVTHPVIGDLLFQQLHKFRTLRTRPYEVHVSLQHAPQLWNFIEARRAQEFPHPGNPRIIIGGPCPASIRLGLLTHGAELVTIEIDSSPPHAFLMVENWARRTQLYCQSDQRQNGQSKD